MGWIGSVVSPLFKLAANTLDQEIKALVNVSIENGKFFSKWKMTKVLPGFKNKGSKFDAKFYRPISNLSEVSKLVEMAVRPGVRYCVRWLDKL